VRAAGREARAAQDVAAADDECGLDAHARDARHLARDRADRSGMDALPVSGSPSASPESLSSTRW
jgi:hypothetical protein